MDESEKIRAEKLKFLVTCDLDWLVKEMDRGSFSSSFAPRPQSALASLRAPIAKFLHSIEGVTHDEVIGNEAAHTALREALEAHKHRRLYEYYNMKPCKGVLLWGPPGCGKTMFGKLAANLVRQQSTAANEFMLINATELQSMWVGETEKTIRAIFAYAREYEKTHGVPLVIFIDEADAVFPPRETAMRFEISNVSTFLSMLDGVAGSSGAFLILATNRPEHIDEALLRDGRIDRKIKVERPNLEAANTILFRALTGLPLQTGYHPGHVIDYLVHPQHVVAPVKPVFPNGETREHTFTLAHLISGAMIVGLVNRAKGIAFRRDLEERSLTGISLADFKQAVDELLHENRGLNHSYAFNEYVEAFNKREALSRAN